MNKEGIVLFVHRIVVGRSRSIRAYYTLFRKIFLRDILDDSEAAAGIEKATSVAATEHGKNGLIARFQQVKKLFTRMGIVSRYQSETF
jgi:hypothetical protein